jgi:hypothetical protein
MPVMAGSGLAIASQVTAINAINYHAPTIRRPFGGSDRPPPAASGCSL